MVNLSDGILPLTSETVTNVLLRLADNDVEVLNRISQYVSTVDWEDVIRVKAQRELNQRIAEYDELQRDFLEGYRYCDACHELAGRTYGWSHQVGGTIYYPEKTMYKVFCPSCHMKWQNEVPYEQKLYPCKTCGRLLLYNRAYKTKNGFYCSYCIGDELEKQFILCEICQKKTTHFRAGNGTVCSDCEVHHPYKALVNYHLGRARAAGTPATLTLEEWIVTVNYFQGKCAYCRTRSNQVLEHFLSISMGGGTTSSNCVPSCHACNHKKARVHPDNLHKIFPNKVIEYIKQYLVGEKPIVNLHSLVSRSLLVLGSGGDGQGESNDYGEEQ